MQPVIARRALPQALSVKNQGPRDTNFPLTNLDSLQGVSMLHFLQRQRQATSKIQLWYGSTNINTTEISENKWCKTPKECLSANILLNVLCK